MESFIILILFVVLPLYAAYKIAENRNRSIVKCMLVAFLFGWLGVAFLAGLLKTRDRQSGFLK